MMTNKASRRQISQADLRIERGGSYSSHEAFCSLKSGNFETRYFTGNIHCKISIYIPVLLIIPLAPYSTLTVRTSTVRRSTVRHVGYFVPRTECTYSTVLSTRTGTHLLLLVRRTGTRPY